MSNTLTYNPHPTEVVATITTKGQVTVPVEVRKHLGVKPHDKVAFVVSDEGVSLKPATFPTISALKGKAGTLKTKRSLEEIEDIARQEQVREYR